MVVKGKVVGISYGEYTTVALDTEQGIIMATILPNWNIVLMAKTEYYVELEEVKAGDEFYSVNGIGRYKSSNVYIRKAALACVVEKMMPAGKLSKEIVLI